MSTIHALLDEYGESHQNKTNKTIHWICVPSIMVSLIGLLWAIPVPALTDISPFLNIGTIFISLAFIYYIVLSIPLTLGMVMVALGMVVANYFIAQVAGSYMWLVSIGIFAVAWVGQFIGHNIEGKKPSFLKDLQFLLIGPMWLLSFIYRQLGIKY